ncbi:YhzD family protein [Caldibacillus lycopersici]|uniref:YhzD family protein n=1 Tax=Perspicuibacillus lycopersici TaxID=1325689 RepID=A0AAE3IQH4_9BACI|nr:YhzD family protein [Perspicuibacillus lycopersici]MCU9612526.1 YhzD family protein [Perspicuibacillus lycopersici]
MQIYKLTVFEANGEKILDESIEAETDAQAKHLAEKILNEKNGLTKTHRLVSPEGRLILFHV